MQLIGLIYIHANYINTFTFFMIITSQFINVVTQNDLVTRLIYLPVKQETNDRIIQFQASVLQSLCFLVVYFIKTSYLILINDTLIFNKTHQSFYLYIYLYSLRSSMYLK